MCKVLMIAGIKPEHVAKVSQLAKAAAKNMSMVEDDGVGYAAITKDGEVYGEKWRNKEDAFEIHSQPKNDPVILKMNDLLGDMAQWAKTPTTSKIYDSFGVRSAKAIETTVGLILHARKATANSDKTIENVHPFVTLGVEDQPDTALIHNGSIVNHEKLTKKMSTCDSEVILHEYLANMMFHNPWGIEQVSKTLIGGYVVGVLSSMLETDGSKIPVLDVFKSDLNKDLHAGYIPELETVVFATNETVLENSCKEVGLTLKNVVKIKEGYLLRINAITGVRLEELISFTPSAKWDNDYTKNHTNSMVPHSMMPHHARPVGPLAAAEDDITETLDSDSSIESAKKHFERRHQSLFTMPYIEVNGSLESNERALFSELSTGPNTNHKALHLVAVALAAANTKV